MRRKNEAVLSFESNDDGLPKVVRDYRARYRAISQVLDKNPGVLDLVDRDLQKLSRGGRQGAERCRARRRNSGAAGQRIPPA